MIDLHCHCLPGVDDGPATLEEALALCRAASDDGCDQIVATPHQRFGSWWNCNPENIIRLCDELNEKLEGRLLVHPGAEIRIDERLLEDLDAPGHSGILSLARSDYLLLEYSRLVQIRNAEDLVHELILAGWRPILAHPEFIPELSGDLDLLRSLVEAGSLVQITAASVTGDFGRAIRKLVSRMIEEDLVHFVASDAHDTEFRPPRMGAAASIVSERWGDEVAERLTHDNPLRVLSNQELGSSPAIDRLARNASR